MKARACALFIAAIMLFSFVCPAENGYVTVSDPYYTDGTNEFDLTGLSANVSYAKAENLFQLIFRAITSDGQTMGGIQMEEDIVSLYADGFSSAYTVGTDVLLNLLEEATDGETDISGILPFLFSEQAAKDILTDQNTALADAISDLYGLIYRDGSQLTDAKSGQVDTFLHSGMNAFIVPIEISAEEVDEKVTAFMKEMDDAQIATEEVLMFLSGDDDVSGMTASSLYAERTRPLGINVKGNAYYGENDIFVEWNLCYSDNTVFLPVYLEVTNTEIPAVYLNIPIDLGEDCKLVLYATIESSRTGNGNFLEMGVLENERTIALVTYQEYMSADMPVQDFYLGLTSGRSLYNFSYVHQTDNATARALYASAYLDGTEIQISYDGTITTDYGDKNEQGTLKLGTNFGIQARANVGFGAGSGEPTAFIPEGTASKALTNLTEYESAHLMSEFGNFITSLTSSLAKGVPGFARLFGEEDAQG